MFDIAEYIKNGIQSLSDEQITQIRNLPKQKTPFDNEIWYTLFDELNAIFNIKTNHYRMYPGRATDLANAEREYCKIRLDQLAKENCNFALFAIAAEFMECTSKLIDSPFLISDDHWANFHQQAFEYMYDAGLQCTESEAEILRNRLDEKISDAHRDMYGGYYGEELYFKLIESYRKIYFTSLSRKKCAGSLIEELDELLDEDYTPNDDCSDWMAAAKMDLLSLKGASEEKIKKERERLGNCTALIRRDMEKLVECGDVKEAAKLGLQHIEGCKSISSIYDQTYYIFTADVCKQAGMNAEGGEVLVNFLKDRYFDSTTYSIAKQMYSEAEWLDVSTKLKNSKDSYFSYYDIAAMEVIDGNIEKVRNEMMGDRLDYVIADYRSFERNLYDFAPELLRDVVKTYVEKYVDNVRGSKKYQALGYWVAKLCDYPKGEEVANELVDKWKKKYPNRKKMFEEIDDYLSI